MADQGVSRRRFLQGSSAAAAGAAGALLLPGSRAGAAERAAGPRAAGAVRPVRGATVNPHPYGTERWVRGARTFDSYVGLPLATTIQKIYLTEGEYFTDPLPDHLTGLTKIGCQFIICVYPSRTTDERAKLAAFLRLLTRNGIVYQAALTNEWNSKGKFDTPQAYLDYWVRYAPVVQAAGVPLCTLVCASSNPVAYARIEPGFPTSPLPDRYWIDYYAEAYRYQVRLDTRHGLLDQAARHGVPVGIAEFGYSATGGKLTPFSAWQAYCPYLAGLAPRLPLGCLYWGSKGPNILTGPTDPKVPGIQQVMHAF